MIIDHLFPRYPDISDEKFNKKILKIKEFHDLFTGEFRLPNGNFVYQELAKRLLSPHTPYHRMILNYGTGTGKTRTVMNIVKEYSRLQGQKPALFLMESPKNKGIVTEEYQKVFGAFEQKSFSDRGKGIAEAKYMKHVKTKTYKTLAGELAKVDAGEETMKEFIDRYSGRIIIYDEVHNLKVEKLMKASNSKWDKVIENVEDKTSTARLTTGKKTFDAIRRFSHMLEGTGNVHLLLTATIMVNSPEEIASLLDIGFPELEQRIDSSTIKNFYELSRRKGTGIKRLLRELARFLPPVDPESFVIDVERKNKIDVMIDQEREESIRKNLDNKVVITDLVEEKKLLESRINSVISHGLQSYLGPMIQGRVLKVSEIRGGPREIKQGGEYEVRGVKLDLFPVEMTSFQALDYIDNERDTAGKAFKTKILEALIFTFPFVVTEGGETYLTTDIDLLQGRTSEYDDVRRAKEADIVNNTDGVMSLTPMAIAFFGDPEEGDLNLKDCSAVFHSILNIIKERKDEQIFIKLTFLENIRILTAIIKYMLDYAQFTGKGDNRIGTLDPVPEAVMEQIKAASSISERERLLGDVKYNDKPARRLSVITGGTSTASDQNIVKSFNKIENRYGDYLKIIIGSRATAESINFPYARNLIRISEWNPAKDTQVRGRVFRVDSQLALPENERYVNVFNMTPVFEGFDSNPNKFSTAYTMMYALSKQKGKDMDLIHKIIDKRSLTRYIGTKKKVKDIDISGFLSYYETSLLADVKQILAVYFMSNSFFTVDDLLKRFPSIHKLILELALVKIRAETTTFSNSFGIRCFIRQVGDTYFLQETYDRSTPTESDIGYSKSLFVKRGESEVATLVRSYKEFAKTFLTSHTDPDEFIERFLELGVSEKVAVFETSFFTRMDEKVRAALMRVTDNLYYSFPEDRVVVHIMARTINTNYKANTKRVNVTDQRMRGLRVDSNDDWFDVSDTETEAYIETITRLLKRSIEKMNKYNLYGLVSILDNTYRLCDNRGNVKVRKDGKTDQRTCKRGFICNESKFFQILPYLVELDVIPYDKDISKSPHNLLQRARDTVDLEGLDADDELLLLWLHPDNRRDSCKLLFSTLDKKGMILYK